MPNRPARFTVADLRRAVRVAELSGPNWCVEILPDGTIRLAQLREPSVTAPATVKPLREVVF